MTKRGLSDTANWGLKRKTLEIHGGSSIDDRHLRPTLHRVVGYPLGSAQRAKELFEGSREGFVYTRINNPTVDRLERRYAELEGAEASLGTSSGMSAIFLVALSLAHGAHIVSSNRLYGGVYNLFQERLPKLGIDVTFVEDPHQLQNWEDAIRKDTKFLYVETPSNPLIDVFDVEPLARLAHSRGIPLVVDDTLATPALFRPLEHGADIVVASLSKYIGDGKCIGGIIAGKKDFIDFSRLEWFRNTGACMSPDNAIIFLDDLESLSGRMSEHCRNAEYIARFLRKHPKVKKVFYPNTGKDLKKRMKLMPDGFGGLMAFEIYGGVMKAWEVLESLRLFRNAANIGEAGSLIVHPDSTTHGEMPDADKFKAGITPGLLRLSIGREDPRDLVADLDQALGRI